MAQLPVPSDALVVFGVTGDLAFKQIFPALQAMVRHKHLSVPVLGVARSDYNLEQLRDGLARVWSSTAASSPPRFRSSAACFGSWAETIRTPAPTSGSRMRWPAAGGRSSIWPSRPASFPPWSPAWPG